MGNPTVRLAGADIHNLVSHIAGFIPIAVQEAKSGAGAINVTSLYTALTSTGAQATTLADAAVDGQLKIIHMIVDGGTSTLTLTTAVGNNTIAFADAGDAVILAWSTTAGGWIILAALNLADGISAPALSTV